jgi:hypothetical protein
MAIYLPGGGFGEAPFNRTFFNVTLGDVLARAGKEKEQKLTLYISDGTTLDVCNIEELGDNHLMLRAYGKNDEACDLTVHLIPYGLIYRIEITAKSEEDSNRVGFHWTPATRKVSTSKRTAR